MNNKLSIECEELKNGILALIRIIVEKDRQISVLQQELDECNALIYEQGVELDRYKG